MTRSGVRAPRENDDDGARLILAIASGGCEQEFESGEFRRWLDIDPQIPFLADPMLQTQRRSLAARGSGTLSHMFRLTASRLWVTAQSM